MLQQRNMQMYDEFFPHQNLNESLGDIHQRIEQEQREGSKTLYQKAKNVPTPGL